MHVEILEKFCIESAAPPPRATPSLSLIASSRYSRDGGINSSELKGDMILTVNSESAAFVRVNLAPIRDKSLQLKNHPNINKQVRLAFPVGIAVTMCRVLPFDEFEFNLISIFEFNLISIFLFADSH